MQFHSLMEMVEVLTYAVTVMTWCAPPQTLLAMIGPFNTVFFFKAFSVSGIIFQIDLKENKSSQRDKLLPTTVLVIKLHRSTGHLHRLLHRLYVASAQTFKLSFNLTLCNRTFSIFYTIYSISLFKVKWELSLKHVHVNPVPHLCSRRQNKLEASSFNMLWLRDGFTVLFKESWWLIISTILTLIFSQSERFWSESSSSSSQIAQHAHRTEAHSLVVLAVRLSGHVMETDVISNTLHDKWLTAPLFW